MFTRLLKIGLVYLLAMGLLVSTVSLGLAQEPEDGVVVLIKEFPIVPDIYYDMSEFTQMGDYLYFYRLAYTVVIPPAAGARRFELWRTDGTNIGTSKIMELELTGSKIPPRLIAYKNSLYIQIQHSDHGIELWRSDGFSTHDLIFKDMNSGQFSGNLSDIVVFNDTIYFSAYDLQHGHELWISDGTSAGTSLFKDLNPGTGGTIIWSTTEMQDELYFVAYNDIYGQELWKTDGTVDGTSIVKDIQIGLNGSVSSEFTAINNHLFFVADDGIHGPELWKSDGTADGTLLVKDIITDHNLSQIQLLTPFKDSIYFYTTGAFDIQPNLWKSDGTLTGTTILKDSPTYIPYLVATNKWLYFVNFDEHNNTELWKSDGTITGTVMVRKWLKDPHYPMVSANQLVNWGEMLFFIIYEQSDNDNHPRPILWRSDGTLTGTHSIQKLSSSTRFHDYILYKGSFFFVGSELNNDNRLWSYIPDPYRHHLPLIFRASPE